MATIEQRIEALENARNENEYPPFPPRGFFYGEPLPEDLLTNPRYRKILTRDQFYGRAPMPP